MDEEKDEEQVISLTQWIILITAASVAVILFIAASLFTVKNVIVDDNGRYDQEIIANAVLNDDMSWNSLYVYFKYRFVDAEELPFIDGVDVTLAGPHTLKIKVNEKAMLGFIELNTNAGKYVYFDTDGYVVEISDNLIEGVPEIKGLSVKSVTLYEVLPVKESLLKDLLSLTQALKRIELEPEAITYDGSSAILSYGDVKVEIGSDDNLTQKVQRLEAIYPKLEGKKGTLHLENWSEDNTTIVFDNDVEVPEEDAEAGAQDDGDEAAVIDDEPAASDEDPVE